MCIRDSVKAEIIRHVEQVVGEIGVVMGEGAAHVVAPVSYTHLPVRWQYLLRAVGRNRPQQCVEYGYLPGAEW